MNFAVLVVNSAPPRQARVGASFIKDVGKPKVARLRKSMVVCLNSEWVKRRLEGESSHRLPVVATGLIPCIYRRASFSHRATPVPSPRGFAPIQQEEPSEEPPSRLSHGRVCKG